MRDFLDELAATLSIEQKRNVYSLRWRCRSMDQGPLEISADAFEFYVRADTKNAASRLRTDGSYRARNWRSAAVVLKSLAEASGNGHVWHAAASIPALKSYTGIGLQPRRSLGAALVMGVITGAAAFLIHDLKAGITTALLVLGLSLLSERLADVQLNQPVGLLNRVLISLGALLPAVLGEHPAVLVAEIAPLVILSYLEMYRARAVFWIFPGMTLILFGLLPWAISLPFIAAFFISSIIWQVLVGNRLAKRAGLMLMAGVVLGLIASIILHQFMQIGLDAASYSVSAELAVIANFMIFFIGTLLLWIHGTQLSLIPWTMCFSLMVALIPPLVSLTPGGALTGSIGFGLVVVGRALSTAWRSRERSVICGD